MSKLILHLDDEPAIRDILAAHLTQEGYRVISVASPAAALNAVTQNRPDLVISDLHLDEGDGLEIITQLRAQFPDIPIIMLTSVLVDPRIAKQSVAREVDVFLQKSTTLSNILGEVRRLTGT